MPGSASGNVIVSVVANVESDSPLNYRYTATGGRIIGHGPSVVWDFNDNSGPGNYSVTVIVDDGVGTYSRSLTKSITVAEPDCDCPCVCPTVAVDSDKSQVKRGGKLDFEARIAGGYAKEIEYRWKVTNGKITSGQGTPSIEVVASPDKIYGVVTADLVVGLDVDCDCPKEASESVPIGELSMAQSSNFSSPVTRLDLDESTITLACAHAGSKGNDAASKDAILGVETHPNPNFLADNMMYSYVITGGRIIGTGPAVKWDLTDVRPGTYLIAVYVGDGRAKTENDTKTIWIRALPCPEPMPCPSVSLLSPQRVDVTNDFIVRTRVAGDTRTGEQYVWNVNGGELIAGQGSKSVRVRASSTNAPGPGPVVTVTLGLPPEFYDCHPTSSVHLGIPTPK
jgi:PKD repeat protein